MNTSIMRCKNVSSTAPMTGRISPWAIPSFSHAAALSQDKVFQCVHDGSQGAGRAPYMGLQAQTAEKFADRPDSHTSFEAEHQQRGHDQADQPGAACCRCPQRRLRVAVSTANCLKMAMHAAFGKPGVIRQAPDALFGGYVDNPCSTPYPPRETVAYGKGERYGEALCHPSVPRIPTAQSVALFESPEPRRDRRLFGVSTCAPLCPRDVGRHHPRPQKLRGPDA